MTYFKGGVRIGDYEDGARIPKYFRAEIHNALKKIANDTVVDFVIKPHTRSRKQNSFYHGVAVPLVQEMFQERGQPVSASEAHEIIFGGILKHTRIVMLPDGKAVEVRRSSTELTTIEWEDGMTLLRAWCAKEGKQLPFPREDL